jgi:hypothetical protein
MYLSTTNKLQRYKMFFIIIASNKEYGITLPLVGLEPNHTSGSSSKPGTYQMLRVQFLSS